jgi:hypothetical protein
VADAQTLPRIMRMHAPAKGLQCLFGRTFVCVFGVVCAWECCVLAEHPCCSNRCALGVQTTHLSFACHVAYFTFIVLLDVYVVNKGSVRYRHFVRTHVSSQAFIAPLVVSWCCYLHAIAAAGGNVGNITHQPYCWCYTCRRVADFVWLRLPQASTNPPPLGVLLHGRCAPGLALEHTHNTCLC